MMNNNRRSYEILFFTIILLIVPIYWLSLDDHFQDRSLIEGRFLTVFPKFEIYRVRIFGSHLIDFELMDAHNALIGQIKNRDYQIGMEAAAADQFPSRISWIKAAKAVDRSMIQLTFLFLKDLSIPTDNTSSIRIMRDESFLFKGNTLFSEGLKRNIDGRIQNYKDLIRNYPEINFYVFYYQLITESEFDPRLPLITGLDGGRSFDYFEQNLPEGLDLGGLMLAGPEDYQKYYYHTDHHWTIRGAWQAYINIYALLSKNYADISQILQVEAFKSYPDLLFLGTYYRDSLYPMQPDVFEIAKINTPDCTIRETEVIKDYTRNTKYWTEIEVYTQSTEYWNGIYETDPLASHYSNYYGEVYPIMEYECQNESTRNILVIGNSYKTALMPWIAAHYQHSYFLSRAYYHEFSLGDFLKEHPVDDVLFLGNQLAISNPDWMITP